MNTTWPYYPLPRPIRPGSKADVSVRQRIVWVTPELILRLLIVPEDGVPLAHRYVKAIKDPIPPDAKVVRTLIGRNVGLVIESEHFDPVPIGQIPAITPTYEEWRDEP